MLANLGPDKMKQQTPIPPIKDEAILNLGAGGGEYYEQNFPSILAKIVALQSRCARAHCVRDPACRFISMPLYVSGFLKKKKRKNARSEFEIPYYLCFREPHGLGGLALKNQPSPISFM